MNKFYTRQVAHRVSPVKVCQLYRNSTSISNLPRTSNTLKRSRPSSSAGCAITDISAGTAALSTPSLLRGEQRQGCHLQRLQPREAPEHAAVHGLQLVLCQDQLLHARGSVERALPDLLDLVVAQISGRTDPVTIRKSVVFYSKHHTGGREEDRKNLFLLVVI